MDFFPLYFVSGGHFLPQKTFVCSLVLASFLFTVGQNSCILTGDNFFLSLLVSHLC